MGYGGYGGYGRYGGYGDGVYGDGGSLDPPQTPIPRPALTHRDQISACFIISSSSQHLWALQNIHPKYISILVG